jgi:DNA repair exonuclease SbcCD ATPase subunit
MLFREIHIRNFRKLVSPLVINGLGRGLTVIVGDNEEGKSTLLDAIRAGLFERHNLGGQGIAQMQPFGSQVRPEIRLDFEIDGRAYSLTKAFAQRARARLETPDGSFEGPAAEEELAKLLAFRVPRHGLSTVDDRGVLGLFWLEQARSLDALRFGEAGRSTLRASFEEEVGDILGGTRGRRLLAAARAKRDALLTTRGAKKGGDLDKPITEAQELTRRVQQLEEDCSEYDREIDELGRVQAELAQIVAQRQVENAGEALADAEAAEKEIEELRSADEAAAGAVALAEAEFQNASDRWVTRQALVEASETRTEELTAARDALTSLDAKTKEVVGVFEEANEASDKAVVARSTAETRLALSEKGTRREALDGEIAGLDHRISEVDRLMAARAAAEGRRAEIRIDEPALEGMRCQDSAIREACAALSAAATWLRFFPSHRQAVTKDGTVLPGGESVEVTEPTRFALEGFGAVEVEPGGSVLDERRQQLKAAEAALSGALIAAGVANVAEAVTQLAARKKADADISGAVQLIAVHAPEGIEALRSSRQAKSEEQAFLDVELDMVSAPADLADPETERRTLDDARLSETGARAALSEAQRSHEQHSTKLAVARANFENAERNSAEAMQQLGAARLEIPDAELAATLSAATGTRAGAECAKAETVRALAAAKPEEVERRCVQARIDLDTVVGKQRDLLDKEIGLENRLIAADKRQIREELEEARGQQDRAISRRDRVQAEAGAWRLLAETLESAERDAKKAFLGPVLQRVQPFLDLLFPGTGVTLEEDTLEIIEIARDGRTEPYRTLSIGTREQLSILVRLAFAVYLREKGYPAAVILDDALVYADPCRFERMQFALRKAAETVQILILACRPDDWRPLGVPILRLADATTAAFEPA